MKKININECLNELNIVESSEETMKKINGGCTIQIGRCLKDGSYYVVEDSGEYEVFTNLNTGVPILMKVSDFIV